MYHYAANNPVRYTDPDGKWVVNNTDEYILIKTENTGFVVLAPYSIYDGNNLTLKEGTYDDTIDKGKIDGIIFSNGKIIKVSDSDDASIPINIKIGKKKIKCTINFNVSVIVNKVKIFKFNFIYTYLDGLSVFINTMGDIVKKNKEKSGKYTLGDGSETGNWISRNLSQKELQELANGAVARFYKGDELSEWMNQRERQNGN